ncbi:MAG TPA: EamA family transporter [Candidatus Binatia bacterium]|nr:EamA family transporter [Candidatus Binatia bacterium]
MTSERHHRLQVVLAFALVYIFWGSTYLAIGIADEERLAPAVMCAMRFAIAGSLMLVACAAMGRRVRITLNEAARLAAIGCLLLVGGNFGLAWAEQWVPTGFAALIIAVTPIWFLLLEAFVFRGDRLSPRGLLGVVLGLGGIALLFWTRFAHRATLGIMPLVGACTLLLSSFSWSVGSVLSRKWQMKVDPFTATGWEMTFAALGNALVALLTGEHHHIVITARGMMAVLYLVTFGSWVGYTAYIWLLKHVPTPKVATYAYVNPLVAVFLGWLLHGERLDRFMFTGTIIIVAGVALVTTAKVHEAGAGPSAGALAEVESEA